MRTVLADLASAARGLARSPWTATLAAATLAVGLGASAALLAVAGPLVLDPTPHPEADRIVVLGEQDEGGGLSRVGWLTVRDLARENTTLASVGAASNWITSISGDGDPERLEGQSVSVGYLETLGVEPALGRLFRAEEDRRGANASVLLGHGLWVRRFGADPAVVGRSVLLNESPYSVVGVLPPGFESSLAPSAQIFRPLGYEDDDPWACRDCRHLEAIGRLADGVSVDEAADDLARIGAALKRDHPTLYPEGRIGLERLPDRITAPVAPVFRALVLGVGLVLLLTCVNVANLLLARALRRDAELSVRAALGAGRQRLVGLFLAEGLWVGLLGGMLGLLVASWGLAGLRALAPRALPRLAEVGLEPHALGFALGLALLAGLAAAAAPAWYATRSDGGPGSGTRTAGSRRAHRGRNVLVAAEVALAVALLSSTGLLVRSLDRLLAEDPGFRPERVLTFDLQTVGPRYTEDEARWTFHRQVLDALAAVPGVERVALTSQLPFGSNRDAWGVHRADRPGDNPALAPSALRYSVAGDYLGTLGLALEQGRPLVPADDRNGDPVVLINQTLARRVFPGEDPLGKRIVLGGVDNAPRTIVGVVKDVSHAALDEPHELQVYTPAEQWLFADAFVTAAVRTTVDPQAVLPALRAAVWSVDVRVPIANVAALPDLIAATTARRQFALRLFGVFAALALVLAASGLYGVLSAMVAERTREIGIRGALGASRVGILRLVLGQSVRFALVGLASGLVLSLLGARLLGSLLYGVAPWDPLTVAGVSAVLLGVAVLAAGLPALRAARIDPADALRSV